MKLEEINQILKLYEDCGSKEVIARLYELQKIEQEKLLDAKLVAYMHLSNNNNNSYFYTSDKEQIVTNNTGSIIYFNKKLFDFKNINNRKIVRKESFNISEEEIMELLGMFRTLCGDKVTTTNDIDFVNNSVVVSTKHNSSEFDKQEFELIAKLLNYPSFNLSDNTSVIHMQGDNGYAYIKGKRK